MSIYLGAPLTPQGFKLAAPGIRAMAATPGQL
jgi:hypothetical protein